MTTSDWLLALSAVAIFLAPIFALWIGGILQTRSDTHKNKLSIFGTLMALRHDPTSVDSVRALNLIDAAFADNLDVREAWTRYFTSLNDSALQNPNGFSIREQHRRDLLLSMVKALGLSRKISSADLMRAYIPTFYAEATHISYLERLQRMAALEEDLVKRKIAFVPWKKMNPSSSQISETTSNIIETE